ncbi:MAG: DNA gyrase inhibitor YacG [Alphaproteobacteria bacterium]|nr:DNA gyrase inhibitor YacG [Alphaproteobacteria bacterium]
MALQCPQCGKPGEQKTRPFCSRHCKDKDLINWLDGRYVVPGASIVTQDTALEEEMIIDDDGLNDADGQ